MINNILIMLSTYNGSEFLREQLDSLYNQRDVSIHILARDDGSSDETLMILKEYESRFGKMTILKGDNLGASRSFYSLMDYARSYFSNYDYYSFSDQDDYWKPDKLHKAIEMLNGTENKYQFYFCNVTYVDKDLNPIGEFKRNNSGTYKSSIIRNLALGCTMVMNRDLFIQSSSNAQYFSRQPSLIYVPLHDVWAFAYAHCLKSYVVLDQEPMMLYRQYGGNVTQAYKSVWKRLYVATRSVVRTKNAHSKLAKYLISSSDGFEADVKDYLLMIATYRDSIKEYLRILFRIDVSSEPKVEGLLWRVVILMRRF